MLAQKADVSDEMKAAYPELTFFKHCLETRVFEKGEPMMIKRTPIWTTTALLLLACPCFADPDEKALDAYPDVYVMRLSERILQLKVRGPLGTNIVVVATEKGLVVIDTYTAPFIFEHVSRIVEQQFGRTDFAYVVNSHEDVDHAGGNGYFKDIALVGRESLFKALRSRHARRHEWEPWYRGRIQGWMRGRKEKVVGLEKASDEARGLLADIRFLEKVDQAFESGFPIMPEDPKGVISFTDSLRLELGDITIECHACEAGHTPSDILIYVTEEEFLFTGDAAQLYIQKDVNMGVWLKQLAQFSHPDKPVKMVLGGHDEKPSTKEELRNLHDYFTATWESVEKGHEQGLSLEQIKQRCSLEGELARFRSVFNVENLADIHEYNIELVVKRLNQ